VRQEEVAALLAYKRQAWLLGGEQRKRHYHNQRHTLLRALISARYSAPVQRILCHTNLLLIVQRELQSTIDL